MNISKYLRLFRKQVPNVKNDNDVNCFNETMEHVDNVNTFINKFVKELEYRANIHDDSKFSDEEFPLFSKYTPLLKGLTYGSQEYTETLKLLKPALDHHYANNRHHPEHHKRGVNDMDLVDLIELLCDWKAATMRHNDGNINKSLEINEERFNISSQLSQIFKNSLKYFDKD